jgi:hypothetical protein
VYKGTWSKLMGEVHTAANAGPDLAESPNYAQQEVLEQAIAKLILLGKQVGVSADRMIQMLESGFTVAELVVYLAVASEGRVCD